MGAVEHSELKEKGTGGLDVVVVGGKGGHARVERYESAKGIILIGKGFRRGSILCSIRHGTCLLRSLKHIR